MVPQQMTIEQTTEAPTSRPRFEWWVRIAAGATVVLVSCLAVPYLSPGPVGAVLWYIGLDGILWPGLAVILLLCGLVRSIRRRPFWTRWRVVGFVSVLLLFVVPFYAQIFSIFFIPYPTSHADSPSEVRFRLPLDGPVTVAWGGAKPIVNYHAVFPAQCRAYDLLVSVDGKTFRGDGKSLADYYCFGLPLLAPADGTVRSVVDGNPNMPPGELGGMPAGGNQIVIEVAPRQFLFLCHLQPDSITVKAGDGVTAGQVLGRIGNSGNTSEPHLHIHLQDSLTDDEGEGIPIYFHHYRHNGKLIERGMPTGGFEPQIVEHVLDQP
jgi:hypothetical protein